MPDAAITIARSLRIEKWISLCTLLFGALAALPVAVFHGLPWGAGILVGAMLAWLNFRWLKQGLDTLTAFAAGRGNRRGAHVPLGTYFAACFRYGLIGLAVYVIFRYLNVPVLSMILGLCALGAATMVVSVYEILRPQE